MSELWLCARPVYAGSLLVRSNISILIETCLFLAVSEIRGDRLAIGLAL